MSKQSKKPGILSKMAAAVGSAVDAVTGGAKQPAEGEVMAGETTPVVADAETLRKQEEARIATGAPPSGPTLEQVEAENKAREERVQKILADHPKPLDEPGQIEAAGDQWKEGDPLRETGPTEELWLATGHAKSAYPPKGYKERQGPPRSGCPPYASHNKQGGLMGRLNRRDYARYGTAAKKG